MTTKKICAWCGCSMGFIESKSTDASGLDVSHGICDECLKIVMAELEEAVNEYIQKQNESNPGKENENE